MKTIGMAAIAACLLAAPIAAQAKDREAVSFPVSAASVDFNDAASVAAFRKSVARQIAAACNPGDRVGADMAPDWQCRREMAASLQPRLLALAARQGRAASFN